VRIAFSWSIHQLFQPILQQLHRGLNQLQEGNPAQDSKMRKVFRILVHPSAASQRTQSVAGRGPAQDSEVRIAFSWSIHQFCPSFSSSTEDSTSCRKGTLHKIVKW
jgi:hypothetical protein